jgi:hypothetical protein
MTTLSTPAQTSNTARLAGEPQLTERPPQPSRTPRRLRQLQLVAVIALLVFGVVGFVQVLDLRSQLSSAPNLADQYARLGAIETDLVEAGNLTALHGLGASSTQASDRIAQASTTLIVAAAERPGDRDALAALNAATLRYGSLLDQAAQTLPPTAPLAQADQVLNTELRPGLATLRTNLATEAKVRSWGFDGVPLWASAALVLGALILISVLTARSSHRVLNAGLVGAVAAAVIITIIGAIAISTAIAADQTSRNTQFQLVGKLNTGRLLLADLRAGQARAALSTTLSAADLARLTDLAKQLEASKTPQGSTGKSAALLHRAITVSLSKSAWPAATTALLSADTAKADDAFEAAALRATSEAVTAASSEPRTATNALTVMAVFILALAVIGAGAAFAGIGVRLKEYR